MWFDCSNVLINLDHLDYISFVELDSGCKAIAYFQSGEALTFEHHNIEVLKKHFRRILEENDSE